MRAHYDYDRAASDYDAHELAAYLTSHGVEGEGSGMRRKWYCPWHDDKGTPNANLFDGGDGKVWLFCHACGSHGDIIDIALQLRDTTLLSRYEVDNRTQRREPRRTNFVPVDTELVSVEKRKEWATQLDEAKHAYGPWIRRGVSTDTVEELSLVTFTEGQHSGRLVVPFFDELGGVMTITSRSVDGSAPKWRNEAGSKHLLYWTPAARTAPRGATLVLTEGQSDAICAFDCGFASVAAQGSNGFTPAMAQSLRGYRVLVVGDGDEAGMRFAETSDIMLADAFVERRSCTTPTGVDIGDLHANKEALGWLSAQAALPFRTPWKHLHRITADMDMPHQKWLVPDWVPGEGVGCIFGESETYKSWIGCALAQAVAINGTWLGHQVTESGPAVILDWENTQSDLVDRQRSLGVEPDGDLHWMHLPTGSLFDADMVAEVELFLEAIQPRFVFFDSLSRAFEDLEENSASETNRVMKLIMELCANVSAVGLVLHHVNKPARGGDTADTSSQYSVKNRLRGNSALINAVQYAFYTQKGPTGQAYLSCAKQRSGPKPHPMEFEIKDTKRGGLSLEYVRTLKNQTP